MPIRSFSHTLSRRVFLKASGGTLLGTLAFASGPIALLAPSRSWAMPLEALSSREGEILLVIIRQMFPHANLEDAVYTFVVKDLDRAAEAEQTRALLQGGIASLDEGASGDWLTLDTQDQFRRIEALEGTSFFEKIRSTAVVSLYNNPLAFAHFGYQGEEGDVGYLYNGFSDLTWLPDPPQPEDGFMPGTTAS
ncbi:tat (twin-arginine translocation) pathway signal sequence [Halomonas sp. M20]|uniref:tat (twin-arginine translocation) pathway signal sequence n=1 Tax=Halomonas sp. M20 TaxID=2763264 RepID=UPI001D0B2943|nr:tat (twin-arginine translocation) pathway signal sequence [Halomonas sp. M20]